MNPKTFFGELKRRNLYKVAIAYAIVGWLLVQIVTQVFPFLEIPNWVVRLVIALVAIGFPIALVIAWAFELTPEGIKRTEDVDAALATKVGAAQKRSRSQAWIYIALAMTELSWVYLAPGRNDDALRLARQEADLISVERDAVSGPFFQAGLAQIEAWAAHLRTQ